MSHSSLLFIHCDIIVDRYIYVVHVREDSASLSLVNALSLLGIQLVDTLVLALGLHPLSSCLRNAKARFDIIETLR